GEIGLGRDHVHVIALDHHAVTGFLNRHARVFGEQLDHEACMVRIEVWNQREGDPAVGGDRAHESLERLQPAGRGSDGDYGEVGRRCARARRRGVALSHHGRMDLTAVPRRRAFRLRAPPGAPGASIARALARTRDRMRAASGGTMRRHMERQDPPPLVRPLHAPARMSDANAVQGTSAATPVVLPRISNLRHRVPRSETRPEEDVLAVILTSGDGTPLEALTHWRCMAALPFAGLYRSIDFALSNCTNSGIRRVGVATQYKAHSLIQHLRDGWSRLWPGSGESIELWP